MHVIYGSKEKKPTTYYKQAKQLKQLKQLSYITTLDIASRTNKQKQINIHNNITRITAMHHPSSSLHKTKAQQRPQSLALQCTRHDSSM